mmetsp:Transcript_9966/g.20330  ORF Transcript_9966/g.20330 Transcript_9966/m.20330 type:complete len:303 (+) Transcript_9966:96-1004(+)
MRVLMSLSKVTYRRGPSSYKNQPFLQSSRLLSSSSTPLGQNGDEVSRSNTTYASEPFYGSPRPPPPSPLYDTHTRLPHLSKLVLFLKSTLEAAEDPTNADAVATTLDISSTLTLSHIQSEMMKSVAGTRILTERPTAATHMPESTFSSLSSLPSNSFGRYYFEFMSSHGFDPHHRPTVKYVDDVDMAYILLRYRESHDFYHTIYNLPPTVLGEIVLKYIELLEFKLGGAGLQAVIGSIGLLKEAERKQLVEEYIPWVLRNFNNRRRLASGTSLLEVFWEEELQEDMDVLRSRLAIEPFQQKG